MDSTFDGRESNTAGVELMTFYALARGHSSVRTPSSVSPSLTASLLLHLVIIIDHDGFVFFAVILSTELDREGSAWYVSEQCSSRQDSTSPAFAERLSTFILSTISITSGRVFAKALVRCS